MFLWFVSFAMAQEVLYTEEVSTSFEDVQVSFDEQWVAFTTGSTDSCILSLTDWETTTMMCVQGLLGQSLSPTKVC